MDKKELQEVLRLHQLWLQEEKAGKRADLSSANLSFADLSSADLRFADLSSADLRFANLSFANLRSANLSFANLSFADLRSADLSFANLSSADLRFANLSFANLSKTILEKINWLTWVGIVTTPTSKGYGYKLINARGEGVYNGGINYLSSSKFEVPLVNPDVNEQCGCGVNLATFNWCVSNKKAYDNRILLMEFPLMDGDKPNVVCPVGSDGKFRVRKCQKVGEVDWSGNLIKTSHRDSNGRFKKAPKL